MSDNSDGYRLLAQLRGLERQLRRLRSDWRSFRDQPGPERLADALREAQRLESGLQEMARRMHLSPAPGSSSQGGGPGKAGRPAPRDVVAASRDLDAMVWEAARLWKGVRDGVAADALDRLVTALQESADRCATLVFALGGTLPPAYTPLHPRASLDSGPEATITGLASEFDGMLWRLQADWQQARRAPTSDRLRLLLDSFGAAAQTASTLRELLASTGDARFRRAVRVGRQISDGVHFLPYRDPFTGAYNREGFEALAEAELKRCRRYGRPFGLLLLEIAPPHLAGLQRAVATARAELREYDLVARYVDDLLLIGVPEGGAGATRRVASRVLKALRAGDMGAWFRRLSYATLPEDGSTLGGLIQAARTRLQA